MLKNLPSRAWNFAKRPIAGRLDYYSRPERMNHWGGPFNGQESRRAAVLELIKAVAPTTIVETGTYVGDTTIFLARETRLPIHTSELSRHDAGYARERMRANKIRNVHITTGDSRTFLKGLLDRGALSGTVFFYLDAHWGTDLPLPDEIDLIFSAEHGLTPIVMIDDFGVPWDSDYTFDDYVVGKPLTYALIEPLVNKFNLLAYGPKVRAADETGYKRGFVLLVRDPLPPALTETFFRPY